MRPTLLTSAILGLVLWLLSAPECIASFPIANSETNVTVVFEFPDGTTNAITLTYDSALESFRKKPLPKGVFPTGYKIDFWIYAALQSLDLPFETKTVRGQTTIVRISKVETGPDGEWIYYVNGLRSRYHINTQLDAEVKKIRFVFKKTMSNQGAAANRHPAGQSDGADNLVAIVAVDRAFPAAVAELGRPVASHAQ